MENFFDLESYAYGMWTVVAVNVIIFIFFLVSFLRPKQQPEWRSIGTLSAFLVALFTEMFGFPLTIYLLTSIVGSRYPVTNPFIHMNGNLWAVFTGGSIWVSGALMLLGGAAMLVGLGIMGTAWRQIHRSKGELVTTGLYSRVRHPQYSALFLIIAGTLIQWPTIITVAMLPILMVMYHRLARREEKEMEGRFGDRYTTYKQQVPMFWPRWPAISWTTRTAAGLEKE